MTAHSKDEMITECQGLVRFLAQQVRSRAPSSIEIDDLIGYGQLGLMQAARDFDASQGTKFSTFAYYRIRGAIYDGLNKLMWFRSARSREFKYDQMADSFLETTSGESTTADGASSTELLQEVNWLTRTVGALAVSYLASADGVDRAGDVVDESASAPWSEMAQRETHGKLEDAIEQLPAESAALIRAVYYEDQTLQEAANRLKISKSWASRMHARALEQMARTLKQANFSDDADDRTHNHGRTSY